MAVGPKLMLSAGLACAGLGLVGAGANATYTAQVSGTTSVSTGTVALSLNGQPGSDVRLDIDGHRLGPHFTAMTEDLKLENTGTFDLAGTYLALTSPECAQQSQDDQGHQDDQGDGGALAHAVHMTVTDLTHHVTEYDGPLCSFGAAERALRHAPAAGEMIRYQLVLSPDDPIHGLPVGARHSQATLRVTFTGLDD